MVLYWNHLEFVYYFPGEYVQWFIHQTLILRQACDQLT